MSSITNNNNNSVQITSGNCYKYQMIVDNERRQCIKTDIDPVKSRKKITPEISCSSISSIYSFRNSPSPQQFPVS